MSTQTFAVAYSPVAGFPAGSKVDHIAVSITGSTPANSMNQNVAPDTASVVFNNVTADTYSFSVSAVDAAGNTFGTPVTGTFTAVDTTVTLSLPSAATVTGS